MGDGDSISVYVSANNRRESAHIPLEVNRAAAERSRARAVRDFVTADALRKIIQDAGYRVKDERVGRSVLEKKYRIRFRYVYCGESLLFINGFSACLLKKGGVHLLHIDLNVFARIEKEFIFLSMGFMLDC